MGYLLPIQPIQSQQYANRMNGKSYNFAYIDQVEKAQFDFKFSERANGSFNRGQQRDDEKVMPVVSVPPLEYRGYIYPNPANLSPAIAKVVGKGLALNAYV